MYCTNCGHLNEDGKMICPFCDQPFPRETTEIPVIANKASRAKQSSSWQKKVLAFIIFIFLFFIVRPIGTHLFKIYLSESGATTEQHTNTNGRNAVNQSTWKPYMNTNGRYSASFPTTPFEKSEEISTGAPEIPSITMHISVSGTGGVRCGVYYFDIPGATPEALQTEAIYDDYLRGTVTKQGGTMMNNSPCTYVNHKSRDASWISKTGLCWRSRLVVVNDRIYIVSVWGEKQSYLTSSVAEQFFSEFALSK